MRAPVLLWLTVLLGTPLSARADDLIVLLDARSCPNCKLSDADLVHTDLRDADLQAADLRRANLSRARLDGANLRDADLRFSNLQGASLRGADLRGAQLNGTDLRETDLSDALLDRNALEQSHWVGAQGVTKGARSHAGLHNAGVEAAQAEKWTLAEKLFNAAIEANPDEPLSWVARGLSRGEQGKEDLASRDLAFAGKLFASQGDTIKAHQLLEASRSIYDIPDKPDIPTGNGAGSALISGVLSAAQLLGPIALKALMPILP